MVNEHPETPPNPRAEILFIDKKWAAVRQLEIAILLWFEEKDPFSVHTLSKAANDLFAALSDKKGGRVSTLKEWLNKQSHPLKRIVSDMDNFLKHGYRDINKELPFSPFYAEIVMLDSIDCYHFLYGRGTPLMRLFWNRFLICNPDFLGPNPEPLIVEGREIYHLHELSRAEFFNVLWPTFSNDD